MTYAISIETTSLRILTAVNRRVHPGGVATAFGPARDEVWPFLRKDPGLRTDSHNVFYYDHTRANSDGMDVHFGVEVSRRFVDPIQSRDEFPLAGLRRLNSA